MAVGTLYLVATPIGNLEDITLRAIRILKEADLIAAEDTRHSRKLCAHFGITTPLTSFFEHNEKVKGERILDVLRSGKNVALISDAGTPAIADPGFILVRRCREEGIPVAAVPGPSAAIAALSISGLPTDRFAFEGYLPSRSKGRRDVFRKVSAEERTAIFYEAPHRLMASLTDLVAELGPGREIAVVRELTKIHEELLRGRAEEVLAEISGREKVRGEIVLLVAPAPAEIVPNRPLEEVLEERLKETTRPPRQVVKEVAKEFGLPGSEVYEIYLEVKKAEKSER